MGKLLDGLVMEFANCFETFIVERKNYLKDSTTGHKIETIKSRIFLFSFGKNSKKEINTYFKII